MKRGNSVSLGDTSSIATNAEKILSFYKQLKPLFSTGKGVEIMNPFEAEYSWSLTRSFYTAYYNDKLPRKMIFGINPGRFGGGVTGIPFTDPIRLEESCGIKNACKKQAEPSSVFIYKVIEAYGGPPAFYRDFFVTALSPLGFTKEGINLNYYDDKDLLTASEPFIIECLEKQMHLFPSDSCYCLGEGMNYKFFDKINKKKNYFRKIIALPHPRWIMQYRRKKIDEFVDLYIKKLRNE